jgi:hypothetical protein
LRPRCFRPHGSFWRQYLLNGNLTILNSSEDSVKYGPEVALGALAWILADAARAQRFLDLTGLTPDGLRTAVTEPATHRAVLDFLCGHEPDLLAAAEALGVAPAALAALRDRIAP